MGQEHLRYRVEGLQAEDSTGKGRARGQTDQQALRQTRASILQSLARMGSKGTESAVNFSPS